MIYAYIRVSSGGQTVENQRFEIIQKGGYKVDKWFQETKSGTIDYHDRVLNKCLRCLKRGDTLICSELSRLGRSYFMIVEILNKLIKKGITFVTIKENFKLDDTINSKVISFAFGLSAEIERNLISQRTKEALSRLREEGIKLGRPNGAKNKVYKLDKYRNVIYKLLNENKSKYYISKRLKVRLGTLINYLKRENTTYKDKLN